MLHLILGPAGSGKSETMIGKIRSAADAGAAVRTLVPEPFAFTYDKRLYAALGAADFNLLTTGSFRSLTAEILEQIGEDPRDAADDVAKTAVLHGLLRECAANRSLHFFRRQADKAGFLPLIAAQLDELMQSGTSPEQLADAAAKLTGSLQDKLTDIMKLYADYLAELEKRGLRDALCDTQRAAQAADSSGFLAGTHIFLDEFESFTGDQYALLSVMLRDAADVWIAMRTDNPDAPAYTRFDAVNLTLRKLRRIAREQGQPEEILLLHEQPRFADASLAFLSAHLFEPVKVQFEGAPAVHITEARDATLEAEFCAAQIRQLLMQARCKAGDIMVVMHDLADYGSLLEAAFRRYDIPYFMDQRRSVLHTAVMKLPLCLLALMQRSASDDILTLLKTQLSPLHPAEAAQLENYAYTWDIEGDSWDVPFAPETDPEGICESIRQKLMTPLLDMRGRLRKYDPETRTGAQLCELLYRCMEDMGVQLRIGGLAEHLKAQDGDPAAMTVYVQADAGIQGARAIRRLWNRFTELLDALHTALSDVRMSPEQLADLMTAVLRADQIPVPPQTLDAVTVQSAAEARFDKPKILFVLGVNDGKFPADIHAGGCFSESERDLLAESGVELARSVRELCADEQLIVYKTLSAASEALWLCYPLADESGKHLSPSPLLESVRRLFPRLRVNSAAEMGTAFYVSTKAAAYYSFVQDYSISAADRNTVQEMLRRMPEEAQRMKRLENRQDIDRLRITDRALMRRLTGNTLKVSASQLEQTIECPFKGFCAYGLRLYRRQKQTLSARTGGNLVHSCMERLFKEHPQREDYLALTPAQLKAHARQCAADFLQQDLGGRRGKTRRFLRQYARITERMTDLLLHTQQELAQAEFTPDRSELVIGRLGDETGTAPYTLSLPGGMTLVLSGKIDRVDIAQQDGEQYLRIVDYKTGRKEFRLADIYYGLNLQMLLYLFALLDDGRDYPDAKAAGVLYMPAGSPSMRERGDTQSLTEHISNYFRMHGMVLLDRGILTKMERELAGVYIPAARAADDPGEGELHLVSNKNVFTQEQLARLRLHVEGIVRESAALYAEGNVSPRPMRRKEREQQETGTTADFYANACDYCDYRSICGITDPDAACFRLPAYSAEGSARAMRAIMEGRTADDEAEGKEAASG